MEYQTTVFKTLDLPGGTLVPLSSTRGERVRVLSGRVWLTEEGDLRDAFLASGEEATLGGHGLAVIEALTPVRVQLRRAAEPVDPRAECSAGEWRDGSVELWSRPSQPAKHGVRERTKPSAGARTVRR